MRGDLKKLLLEILFIIPIWGYL